MNGHAATSSDTIATALLPALSDAALLLKTSKAIFQRGQAYARSGAVAVTREASGQAPTLHATVQGSEPYETEVWIHEGETGGSCDCMNAADGWFCKHQVALALVWRERLGAEAPAVDGEEPREVQASASRAQTIKNRRQALKEFLHAQPASTLADRLLELAGRDADIRRELQQWRKLGGAPRASSELKALVTEIMSAGSDFVSWQESHGYVHRALAVLDVLRQARARDPALAASLCMHAMRRGWAVLMQSDDSDGNIGGLVQSIGDEWIASLKEAGPQPAAFGDTYLQLLLDDPFGCFDADAAEAVLGAAALARFRKTLAARWREARDSMAAAHSEQAARLARAPANKRRAARFEPDLELSARLWTLEHMHLRQLEAEGDLEGALAIMREDLSAPDAYRKITALFERHGRLREAFANAEQGCKAFADDERLQDDLLRCYDRDGGVAEAFGLRRRRFSLGPSVERYHETLEAARMAARDIDDTRAALHAELVDIEERELAGTGAGTSFQWGARGPRAGQRDVTLRVGILCSEGLLDEALALVRSPAYCANGVLTKLARRLGPERTAQRIELLFRVFEDDMRDSKTPYRRELALVAEIARLLEPARRASWLDQLRLQYKAKRNFVRELPQS